MANERLQVQHHEVEVLRHPCLHRARKIHLGLHHARCRRSGASDTRGTKRSQKQMGLTYFHTGVLGRHINDYEMSLKNHRLSVQILRDASVNEPETYKVGVALNELGNVCLQNGDTIESERCFRTPQDHASSAKHFSWREIDTTGQLGICSVDARPARRCRNSLPGGPRRKRVRVRCG